MEQEPKAQPPQAAVVQSAETSDELSDEQLEQVAGGKSMKDTVHPVTSDTV